MATLKQKQCKIYARIKGRKVYFQGKRWFYADTHSRVITLK